VAGQYIRKCEITIGGQSVDCSVLQAEFQVRMTDVQHPNWAYIRIINLKEETMKAMMVENGEVSIQAGYEGGQYGYIFRGGNLKQARKGRLPNGTDKFIDAMGVDGAIAYEYATVNKSLEAGKTHKDVIDEVAKAFARLDVQRGHISDQLAGDAFTRGLALFGSAQSIARKVAEAKDHSWYIENGKFNIVPNNSSVPGGALEISAKTGMIGLPEQRLDGIVVKILMNPNVKLRQRVHIDPDSIQQLFLPVQPGGNFEAVLGPFGTRSATVFGQNQGGNVPKISAEGMYQVIRIDHDGNTRGQEWYTTLTCIALDDKSKAGTKAANQPSQRGTPEEQNNQQGGGGGGGGQ
jgi:hypothetical protein